MKCLIIALIILFILISPACAYFEPGKESQKSKLSGELEKLVGNSTGNYHTLSAEESGEVKADNNPEKLLRIIVTSKEDLGSELDSLGEMEISDTFKGKHLYQMSIPPHNISWLKKLPISYARFPLESTTTVVSEGTAIINASQLHELGVNGSGVKVAVLDKGFKGYSSLLGSELPSNVTTKSFRQDGDIEVATEHGTACAEIVYDCAPGAELYLVNFETQLELNKAVDWLIEENISIISFSMGYLAAPFDGTGYVADIVSNATSKGVFWVTAGGNEAEKHYEGNFTDMDNDSYHNFGNDDECINFSAVAGSKIRGLLSWSDWPYSDQDYELYLYYVNDSSLIETSENLQNGTQEPYEEININAPHTGLYCFAIKNYSATRISHLELFSPNHDFKEYNVNFSSIIAPADERTAFAVGATGLDDGIHDYSSRGPTNDGRVKPDATSPSGVSSYTYGSFYGTSASTPHVGGAAALLLSGNPSITPHELGQLLSSHAVDLGEEGKDNYYGAGRINVLEPYQNITNYWYVSNSTSIQHRVDMANEGDTIILTGGMYTESVEVNKPLTIRSESKNNTSSVVEPTDSLAFNLTADRVNISGLTIKGGLMLENTSYCNVSNNEFKGTKRMYLHNSHHNRISSNHIYGVGEGITLKNSVNNTIIRNTFMDNDLGVKFSNKSINNQVYLNNFVGSTVYCGENSSNIWNSPNFSYKYINNSIFTSYLGNYWGNYTGKDNNSDGIGDMPYGINGDNKDNFPLMETFENYLIGPKPVNGKQPLDLNNDGLYSDVNGDNSFNFGDIIFFFHNFDKKVIQDDKLFYDFNKDGTLNFGDVIGLFEML